MSSGSAITTGTGPPVAGSMEGARNDFRDARRIVDLRCPFRHRPENGAVIELLECLAVAHVAADLADEHDHRRGILARDMDPADALLAPGPRVTKQMPGRPVILPTASAIMAAVLS
jgi:hypothetical protein